MRLTFLCSSLAAGRDGVGDYTLLLAAECVRQGHACSMIALHDRHLEESDEEAWSVEGGSIPHLRLPASKPWRQRVQEAADYRQRFAPDWVSLQFVPYGFQARGIVAGLGARLCQVVGEESRRHIMFHELWIGQACGATWRERMVGAVQRRIILQLISRLRPSVITTSNATYKTMLARNDVAAEVLPLFGNIPVAEPSSDALAAFFPAHRGTSAPGGLWWGVFFGTLHPAWSAEPLFSVLLEAAEKTGKRIALISVGRMGASGERQWEILGKRYEDKIDFIHTGERAPEEISRILQAADFGVAASPWELIGKSGAAAAMMEHGLPVIVNRDDWHLSPPLPAGLEEQPQLYHLDRHLPGLLASGLPKRPAQPRLPQIARNFMAKLERGPV